MSRRQYDRKSVPHGVPRPGLTSQKIRVRRAPRPRQENSLFPAPGRGRTVSPAPESNGSPSALNRRPVFAHTPTHRTLERPYPMPPRISVICPTYNRGKAILSTLESVRAQTMRDWEMLVVSDASDDDTDAVVASLAARDRRIRLLRTRRFGSQSGPTNIALGEAEGEFVAYLDHDDHWEPDHLLRLRQAHDDGARFVATRARKATAAGAVTGTAHALSLCWHPDIQLMSPLFENSCAGHVAGLAEQVGGWRESPVGLEDWDLWLRFADAGERCTTLLDRTVTLLDDPGTRTHSLQRRFTHEIARFDDALSARAAYRALADARHQERELLAVRKDLLNWYTTLAERGELVLPHGWRGGTAALEAAVESQIAENGTVWKGLALVTRDTYVSLCVPLSTMTAEHADRYTRYFRTTMHHQMAFLEDVLPHGSVRR
ncbi:glycosyltransferase [Streptomyces sp. NPDC057245]|uniref:glycosyltransferase n=1 Tax=Streptomyces sp. NPDC057245 TaxID=3346065 RepID=UPI00363ECA67